MNQTLHIIRKDLRRLRWLLVAWVVIIIGRLALNVAGSSVEPVDAGLRLVIGNLSSLVGLVEMLMWGLLISLLVHDEPLVGADAFWLTRPIETNALMTAKLALAGLFLILGPSVREVIEMAWFGASPRDVLVAAPSFLFTQAFWMLMLLALAVLTPSLTRFVLTIAAGALSFVVAIGAITTLLVLSRSEEREYVEAPLMPDSTAGIVATLLLMCVVFGVIVYQYRHRWLSRAILIGGSGAVAAVIVASMWPWHFARGLEPDPGAWAHDSTRTPARLDATSPPKVSELPSLRPAKIPKKQVATRIDLVGTPPEYAVGSIGVRARLTFSDGTTIVSAQQNGAYVLRFAGDQPLYRPTQLQAVLGDTHLASNARRDFASIMPVLLRVTDADYQRYGDQPGHLSATVDFALTKFRVFGSLPLSAGAAMRDRTDRFDVVRVLRRSDGCELFVRHISVRPIWAGRVPRQFHYVLRNVGRGEAIEGDAQELMPLGELNVAGALFGVTIDGSGAGGFSVWHELLRYPSGAMSASPTPRIDSAWLDGAELVVIESAYAGHVTRTLDIEGFRMRQ